MVHIIVVAHAELAHAFIQCAEQILAKKVDNLSMLGIKKDADISLLEKEINRLIKQYNQEEILILTDLLGATPFNIVKQAASNPGIRIVSGLNLPMLIRAISYSYINLEECLKKALEGGKDGIQYINKV